VGAEDGGDGVGSAGQSLSKCDDVGADVPVLVGEAGEGALVDDLEVGVGVAVDVDVDVRGRVGRVGWMS